MHGLDSDDRVRAGDRRLLPPLDGLLLLLAILGVLGLWGAARQGVPIDFYQFWLVGRAVEESVVDNVYDPDARPRLARVFRRRALDGGSQPHRAAARFRRQQIDAVSTPFLYACFRAIQGGSFDRDLALYRALSWLCFVGSALALGRLLGCSRALGLGVVCWFSWAFLPVRFDLAEGNVNSVQLALLTLWLALRSRPDSRWRALAAGAVLGLAVMFKPNMAFVAVLLALAWGLLGRGRDLRLGASGFAVGCALALAASVRLFGSLSCWTDWLEALLNLDRQVDIGVHWGNFAGARLLRDLLGVDLAPLLLALVGVVAARLWRIRSRLAGASISDGPLRRLDALLIGLGPLVPMLGGGLAWPHYLVLAMPLSICGLRAVEAEAAGRPGAARPLLALAGIVGISSTLPLQSLGVEHPTLHAWALALGTGALFAEGIRQLGDGRLAQASGDGS